MPRLIRYNGIALSADTTIDSRDLIVDGLFVMKTGCSTITWPAPDYDFFVNGVAGRVLNDTASSGTVACTNGFAQSGDSVTVASGECVELECIDDGEGNYIWSVMQAGSSGAMTFGTEPAAVSSSTSGTAGAAVTASRSDHGHDMSPHIHDATHGGQLTFPVAHSDYAAPQAYTPSAVVWDDVAPASVTEVYRYQVIGKSCQVWFDILSADGDGKKLVSIAVPTGITPAKIDGKVYGPAGHMQDTGGTPALTLLGCYLDATQASAANRVIKFDNAVTCTDAQGFRTSGNVRFEIA